MYMVSIHDLQSKKSSICVVGLGYVGLPLAVHLAKHFRVLGFDKSEKRINELREGNDVTRETSHAELAAVSIEYSNDPRIMKDAGVIIIAVPTPIDQNNNPDLTLLENATHTVAQYLQPNTVIVYESTVYPGVTEDICVPIIEKVSGFRAGVDFWVGYSPERINPGDRTHTIDKVTKVVSGMDTETLELVSAVYGAITTVYPAVSIKVAEAAKALENTQRDLNIALMNELAILCNKMNMSVYDVLDAAKTKWNFIPFQPGLVGGHCIGVDPYYLTYKAKMLGQDPQVILAGRMINDSMHKFLAHQIIKKMIHMGKDISQSHVVIFGMTFKENVSDIRNSKIVSLYQELVDFGIEPLLHDPFARQDDVLHEYGIPLYPKEELPKADTLIVAVAHDEFKAYSPQDLRGFMNGSNNLLVDVKRLYARPQIEAAGMHYWSL